MAETIEMVARKYAVKNAFEHEGKAQTGAVVGKVKALLPQTDLKKAMPKINLIVQEINKMKKDLLEEEYKKFEAIGWELKAVEKEKVLPELTWLKKGEKLICRMAPNPSGAMHFGHARPAVLNDEYVKKYGGKLILRFDDTDPKVKTPVEGIEKEFIRDFKWLGIKFDEMYSSSDRLEYYYKVIEKLLKEGNAYVCFCESEKWRELIWKSKPCPCRKKSAKEQLVQWKKMLKHEIKEGEAVVRIKTNLKNPDPSTRDWWIAKVVDTVNHTNKKVLDKHVWPSYNLASAIDDHEMNVNYVIRGQEHVTNGEKQKELFNLMGWKNFPHTDYLGKISKLGDMVLSKSKMKIIMEKEHIARYDDPRMTTIMALRRRGFRAEAIRKIITDCGVSLKEVKITTENFAAANKEFLGEVNEYPFFEEAVQIEIYNMGFGETESYGEKINFKEPIIQLLVNKKEIVRHKAGEIIRLKKGFNLRLDEVTEFGAKGTFISYSQAKNPIVSWLKKENTIDAKLLMSDGTERIGLTSRQILKEKGIIHFEEIGYANIEETKENTIHCVFAHG